MAKAKRKSWTLVKPIDGVFAVDDDRIVTFHAEDVGLVYFDDNAGVARAVALHPESFKAG